MRGKEIRGEIREEKREKKKIRGGGKKGRKQKI